MVFRGTPVSHREIVKAQLRIDEDMRRFPYRDSVGKLTIGVGRNLDDVGLRPDEIDLMLENDIVEAEGDARELFPSFDALSDARKAVLLNMCFNLGRSRLSAFHKFRAAVADGDWELAAAEMIESKWAAQVGIRAQRLAKQMREG
jgi:lysozyme